MIIAAAAAAAASPNYKDNPSAERLQFNFSWQEESFLVKCS